MKTFRPQDIHARSVGIDVSAESLQVRLGMVSTNRKTRYSRSQQFPNTEQGFRQMLKWVRSEGPLQQWWFIMEATGVYYEHLAYYLHQAGLSVCVLVAHRAKHYAKSLPVKSKTDAIDARLLARYGLERQPEPWQPASSRLRTIKTLLRERQQLQTQHTRLTNRRHAARRAWGHPESSLRRLDEQITRITEYIDQINQQLEALWQTEQALAEPISRIAEVAGLGTQSVLQVVAETNGFALIGNRNQLASYVGLDVMLDQSGKRQGTSKISKKGNTHIRQALYMPAVCASQHNRALRAFYQRLVERHPDRKKVALVAVMRKILLLIYSLWKSGQEYDPEFHYQQITKTA